MSSFGGTIPSKRIQTAQTHNLQTKPSLAETTSKTGNTTSLRQHTQHMDNDSRNPGNQVSLKHESLHTSVSEWQYVLSEVIPTAYCYKPKQKIRTPANIWRRAELNLLHGGNSRKVGFSRTDTLNLTSTGVLLPLCSHFCCWMGFWEGSSDGRCASLKPPWKFRLMRQASLFMCDMCGGIANTLLRPVAHRPSLHCLYLLPYWRLCSATS